MTMSQDPVTDQILSALKELALDLRWSWNHSTDELWREIDSQLWELTLNPWVVLQAASPQTIDKVSTDPAFRAKVSQLIEQKREVETGKTWFEDAHPKSDLAVAYFSMEFMLSEALPIYSGGLGNVAGDQLKAASDLGIPVVGIGLLYQQGYFRQEIDQHGVQQALYPYNDPGQLPIQPLRDAGGRWLRIPMRLPEATLWVRAWQAQVGRTKLFLLDTNDPANLPTHRSIAGELYGGNLETRLRQELVLSIAGWRLLSALDLHPQVCHLNEGHAAFVVLERALAYMREHHQPFDVALTVTRAGNLFTTHTPVEAGFDRFPPDLLKRYLASYAERDLQIKFDDLLALGRKNPGDSREPLNMAYLAVRGSANVNGVSRLHGEVSREIFQPLFPRWPRREVPVGYVTNGVHVPTWDSKYADELWTESCGKDRWRGALHGTDCVKDVSDQKLWELREERSKALVTFVRKRLARQRAHQLAFLEDIREAATVFNSGFLTMGFARRFATYKRPNLILHDPERLVRLLTNRERPVQLVLAGKAHPQDYEGQSMIRQWYDFMARADVHGRVVFLSDYDTHLASELVQGVDLWLNTPRRPWEASGTSGMKVLVNGGLNLSELDGWWAEAYSPELGWAIGDGQEHGNDPGWDAHEASALYDLLENHVVPAFYTRSQTGIPATWVSMMRASIAQLTPQFSSNRSVREYLEKYYLPAASAYCRRSANKSALGIELADWSKSLARYWADIRFERVNVSQQDQTYLFEAHVTLGTLLPEDMEIELYAEPKNGIEVFRKKMDLTAPFERGRSAVYICRTPVDRPIGDYTPRIVPAHSGASIPLEASQILWQR